MMDFLLSYFPDYLNNESNSIFNIFLFFSTFYWDTALMEIFSIKKVYYDCIPVIILVQLFYET